VGVSFQGLFHSARSGAFHLSLAVLRSLSVAKECLALRRGRRGFTRSFPCIALLRDAPRARAVFGQGPLTRSGAAFHPLDLTAPASRRLAARGALQPRGPWPAVWALPLSLAATDGIDLLFLFLRLLRCFTSPGFAWRPSGRAQRPPSGPPSPASRPAGLPHSDTHGSTRVGRSPWLFAAYRVLPRLLAPRHP
jgi:hypothetical protein